MNAPSGRFRLLLAVGALLVVFAAVPASVLVGSGGIPVERVLEVLEVGAIDGPDAAIIWQQRLPRAVVALIAGAGLGAAGALTQALTRNPLAEPGTLGISSGASLVVALGIVAAPDLPMAAQLLLAVIGAAVSGVLVLIAGGVLVGRHNSLRLVLAGAALSALTQAATSYLVLGDAQAFQGFRHWHAGIVAPRPWGLAGVCGVLIVCALAVLLVLARAIDALGLGDDMGHALGARPRRTWAMAGCVTVLLASAATALVGPISFLGLAAPLAVRWATGPRTARLTVWSAVAGAAILLLGDVLGRVMLPPREVTAGVMCGLLGAPAFVVLARRAKMVAL